MGYQALSCLFYSEAQLRALTWTLQVQRVKKNNTWESKWNDFYYSFNRKEKHRVKFTRSYKTWFTRFIRINVRQRQLDHINLKKKLIFTAWPSSIKYGIIFPPKQVESIWVYGSAQKHYSQFSLLHCCLLAAFIPFIYYITSVALSTLNHLFSIAPILYRFRTQFSFSRISHFHFIGYMFPIRSFSSISLKQKIVF